MRLNHIIFVIFVTLLFAGSVSLASIDSPVYNEVSDCKLELQESSEENNDSSADILGYISTAPPNTYLSIERVIPSNPAKEMKPRLVRFPILPQAPPAKI